MPLSGLNSALEPVVCYGVNCSTYFEFSRIQVNYGNFMHGLLKENIQLNRKVLSEISMHEPYSFKALVDISRNAFPGNKNVVHPPRKVDMSAVNV
ncbi:50S RIBOSOMAL PROTEIN L20 [Salix koriyanagi]|uniref:Large ribosomal subunit protein bL20c n=1 Tax=Salix koriyanagi TaxID=2511006 RepID=A0A9Q0ZZM8_9ROSI|nr:50S RIBOSOMAL PROTEIN L20 [Salix koriyanagi]